MKPADEQGMERRNVKAINREGKEDKKTTREPNNSEGEEKKKKK